MDLNATLFGQMLTFAVFVWFTMRFVWPPITRAMQERQEKIAEGLAAGERARRELELAHHKAEDLMRDAKIKAAQIIEEANKRATKIIEESQHRAREEGDRLLKLSQEEIAKAVTKAKTELKIKIANIAIAGAEKILEKNIDAASNAHLVERLITEL